MDTRHHGASAATVIKPHVFSKMESLVREMQDPETGIPIRPQKIFLTSIPSAFMGYDLIEWLLDRLDMYDSAEAIHLANLLCQYGYFFPVGETRSLIVKDDSSLYRFQTPYYWASQNHSADTTDYAIYLTKRLARNKQKHGLEDYELEAFGKLKKGLQHKWDFVTMQAEEQVKLAKDRKKGDKIVTDSQERAYWRVYRPPPGFNNCLESAPVPDRGNVANRVRKKTLEERKKEVEFYAQQIERVRLKVSQASEGLMSQFETYNEFDFFLVAPQPTNPWSSGDDTTFWDLNESIIDIPTEKRVRKWAINFSALISDPTGLTEFTNYLRKEYCHENIRFWQAVNELRYGQTSQIADKVKSIYDEFLKPGAPCEINIDGKTMEMTQQHMKNPTRFTYDAAAEHVYVLLLKKDCYPRYLRSEQHKNLLANAVQPMQKKRFFSFGGPGKKKVAAAMGANSATLQAQTPQPLKRHGSDEHTAFTSGIGVPHGAGDLAGTTLGHQPRGDCEPPYRGDLAALKQVPQITDPISVSSIKSSETLELTRADDVCPWETAPILSVVPYRGEPILQKLQEQQKQEQPIAEKDQKKPQEIHEEKPQVQERKLKESPKMQQPIHKSLPKNPEQIQKDVPKKQTQLPKEIPKNPEQQPKEAQKTQYKRTPAQRQQQHSRFHQSLPHNVSVKQSVPHFKPHPPDRSRSVDVNPAGSSIPGPAYGHIVDTRPKLNITSPVGPEKNEKDKANIWDTHLKRDKISLSPAGTYQGFERRASEGSRLICDRFRGIPIVSWREEVPLDEKRATTITALSENPESPSLLGAHDVEPHLSSQSLQSSNISPGSGKRFTGIDYTVRSGHFPGQYALSISPQTPPEVPLTPLTASDSVVRTSTAPYTFGTMTTTTTQTITSVEQKQVSIRPKVSEVARAGIFAPVPVSSVHKVITHSSPQDISKGVVAPWEESPSQKVTDVCPWEDEESCKVDTPFVKTYATLGYL